MRVQLIYFDGCPNADGARNELRAALARLSIATRIEEISTTAPDVPAELRRWGSPTILIDGVDVGGDSAPSGASCRLYSRGDGRLLRIPPAPLIDAVLSRARRVGSG